jgi:hypothetical protein
MGGEGACCGAGRRTGYIMRMEKTKDVADGFLGRKTGEAAVMSSEGCMPGRCL